MAQTPITIQRVAGDTDLYCRYIAQSEPQPCHIGLDPESDPPRVWASFSGDIGGAVPMDVYHGRERWYGIPTMLASEANELMERLRPLLGRVVEGYGCQWDGNNRVGRLTEDAREAEDEIERICEAAETQLQVWEAEDWLSVIGGAAEQAGGLGITAATSDDDLSRIEGRVMDQARAEGAHHLAGLPRELERLRDWCREHGRARG